MNAERGRPRSFDPDLALEQATEVFWRHGFQGASLAELTEATGLSKPSLYAAFGDKESLYLHCLRRYADRAIALQTAWLEQEADTRKAIEGFLRASAQLQTDPKLPGGCFIVNGTADCGAPTTPPAVEAALRNGACGSEQRLLQRLQQAEKAGELPAGTSAKHLAALFSAVLTGMAMMAKAGQPRDKLLEVVDAAMLAWPQPGSRRVKAR